MTCTCGHELDEHDDKGADCYADDCDCIHYERDDDGRWFNEEAERG